LDWVENALGKFRDVVPNTEDREPAFPPTAAGLVRHLAPKRFHRHPGGQQPLVKPQDLPNIVSLNPDEPSLSPKRGHGGLTANQKAELLDDESEEEDFDKLPLVLEDIRLRAQQSVAKKRRRNVGFRAAGEPRTEDLGGTGTTATTATPSRGPSRMAAATPGRTSPLPDASPLGRKSSSALGEVSPTSEAQDENEDSGREDGAGERGSGADAASAGGSSPQALANGEGAGESPGGQFGGGPVKPILEETIHPSRSRRAIQAQLAERTAAAEGELPEIGEEELGLLFLKKYKMSREDLELVASRMGIHLSNLCFVKQEFDLYDEAGSGCIDVSELRSLLCKLGEEPTEQELEAALRELDAEGTGEVEFFEFCSWFTAEQ